MRELSRNQKKEIMKHLRKRYFIAWGLTVTGSLLCGVALAMKTPVEVVPLAVGGLMARKGFMLLHEKTLMKSSLPLVLGGTVQNGAVKTEDGRTREVRFLGHPHDGMQVSVIIYANMALAVA